MPTDRKRIHDALRFYIERVTWPLGDTERDAFMRLRDEPPEDLEVSIGRGRDGVLVVEIDSSSVAPADRQTDGVPRLRVYVNDGVVFESQTIGPPVCVKCGDRIEDGNETASEDTPTCFPCQGAPEL